MIENLLYVKTTRPYVMQDLGLVDRFQSYPKETHVAAVKRIIRYLKGTLDYGLWYPKCQDFTLKAFTDPDWAKSIDERKSTNGATIFLGNWLVSWLRKKQTSIALSTT